MKLEEAEEEGLGISSRPCVLCWPPTQDTSGQASCSSNKKQNKKSECLSSKEASCFSCGHQMITSGKKKKKKTKTHTLAQAEAIGKNDNYFQIKSQPKYARKQSFVETLFPPLLSARKLNFPLSPTTTTKRESSPRKSPFLFLIQVALVLVLITNLLTSQIVSISASQIIPLRSASLQRSDDNNSILSAAATATKPVGTNYYNQDQKQSLAAATTAFNNKHQSEGDGAGEAKQKQSDISTTTPPTTTTTTSTNTTTAISELDKINRRHQQPAGQQQPTTTTTDPSGTTTNSNRQFKYHLNHLRPPSLVPITIQQVPANGYYYNNNQASDNNNNNHFSPPDFLDGLFANNYLSTRPAPELGMSDNKKESNSGSMGKQKTLSADPMSAAQTTTTATKTLLEEGDSGAAGSRASPSSLGFQAEWPSYQQQQQRGQLLQLQLPLQLHLKLRPLPLPLPPPPQPSLATTTTTTTTSTTTTTPSTLFVTTEANKQLDEQTQEQQVASSSEKKRRRSLEQQEQQQKNKPQTAQLASLWDTTTTTSSPERKRDLMALTWQEAKRILLLSSMSPMIAQNKFDRRSFGSSTTTSTTAASLPSLTDGNNFDTIINEYQPYILTTTIRDEQDASKIGLPSERQATAAGKIRKLPSYTFEPFSATSMTTTTTTTSPDQYALLPRDNSTAVKVQLPTTTTTATQTTPATASPQHVTSTSTAAAATTTREVRRQRHSSQQNQQGQLTTMQAAEIGDSRIQAMAAAMLPFFWPSFQLSSASSSASRLSSQQKQQQQQVVYMSNEQGDNNNSSTGASNWPMRYTQLRELRPQNGTTSSSQAGPSSSPLALPLTLSPTPEPLQQPVAPSQLSPVHLSPSAEDTELPTTTTTTTTGAPGSMRTSESEPRNLSAATLVGEILNGGSRSNPRRKRRRPTYLTQTAPASPLSTPYQDSTRLASTYPMPKIKFQPLRHTTTTTTTTTTAAASTTTKAPHTSFSSPNEQRTTNSFLQEITTISPFSHSKVKKLTTSNPSKRQQVIPKNLSKLIERQLQMNATDLLMKHKRLTEINGNNMAPPTTSVSKVVRLKNDTDLQIVIQAQSPLSDSFMSSKRRFFMNDFERYQKPKEKQKSTTTSTTPSPSTSTITITSSSSSTSAANTEPPATGSSTLATGQLSLETHPSGTTEQSTTFNPHTTPSVPRTTPDSMTTTTTTTSPPPVTDRERLTKPFNGGGANETSTTVVVTNGDNSFSSLINEAYKTIPLSAETSQTSNSTTQPTINRETETTTRDNKILSDDGDFEEESLQRTTTTTTTSTTSTTTRRPKGKKFANSPSPNNQQATQQQQKSKRYYHNNNNNNNNNNDLIGNKNNIKLFHFKRKPDMKKLPFYKKPLNYTELGWTPEQIQEHLESTGFLGLSDPGDFSSGSDEQPIIITEEGSLLKRKRRGGRNQFERLMAELHGQQLLSSGSSLAAESSISTTSSASDLSVIVPNNKNKEEDLVPVIRKKEEPLVLKPMFFVMNQNKNRQKSSAPNMTTTSAANTDDVTFVVDNNNNNNNNNSENQSTTTTTTTTTMPSTTTPLGSLLEEAKQNKSKPIIRMRRKHHDQPTILSFRESFQQQPWRPSRPFWSTAVAANMSDSADQLSHHGASLDQTIIGTGERSIMFVPSSLLTPSGSHLVPLYTPAGVLTQSPLKHHDSSEELDSNAWQRQQQLQHAQSGKKFHNSNWEPKPSGGLAPSGEESFLLAPSSIENSHITQLMPTGAGERLILVKATNTDQQVNNNQSPPAQINRNTTDRKPTTTNDKQRNLQQQQASMQANSMKQSEAANTNASSGDLKVPKLLIKPMRPAKYSLNGYIPKPSLNQQQQSQQPQMVSQQQQQQMGNFNQLSSPFSTHISGAQNSKLFNQSTANNKQTRNKLKPHQQILSAPTSTSVGGNVTANKDLDSSTSNEIFSRRRGLQQHLRSSGNSKSFNSNFIATNGNNNNGIPALPTLKQMEDNKRKYLVKQQQQMSSNRTPTLSAQKINQIKAKLGLTIINSNSSFSRNQNKNQSSPSAASTNSISISSLDNLNQFGVTQSASGGASISDKSTTSSLSEDIDDKISNKLLIGAPLNSIPKTDFECTDKKGKFVSGLFADHKTGCQVWHLCSNNRKYSFLCPSGTIFNEKVRICDWRYNVKCEENPLML